MQPAPADKAQGYRGAGKLEGKVALVTGGNSGIGRAVAIAFAKEGADVAIAYLEETDDARETQRLIGEAGRRCRSYALDLGRPDTCRDLVRRVLDDFGRLDVVVNNAAEQHPCDSLEDITPEQLERTFRTNLFAMFYLSQAALPHLGGEATIVNTTSVTAFHGNPQLIDYSATKGGIVAFTHSLAKALASRGIRVNAVAPGPVWTPLIPSTFEPDKVASFGAQTPLGRAGQPDEIAPCFVFLASADSSYMTGEILHPNGGEYFA